MKKFRIMILFMITAVMLSGCGSVGTNEAAKAPAETAISPAEEALSPMSLYEKVW